MVAAFLAVYTTCHICGRGRADTVDHDIPVSIAPHLKLDQPLRRPAYGARRTSCTCRDPSHAPVRLWSVGPGVIRDSRGSSRTPIKQLTGRLASSIAGRSGCV